MVRQFYDTTDAVGPPQANMAAGIMLWFAGGTLVPAMGRLRIFGQRRDVTSSAPLRRERKCDEMKTARATARATPCAAGEGVDLDGVAAIHRNLSEPALVQAAVVRGEGVIGRGGALLVTTGRHTGRSPRDKFVVREPDVEAHVWWDNNASLSPERFERLHGDMLEHVRGGELFVQDLYAGADPAHRLNVRVITELAWHGLFIRHLLRRPERAELDGFAPGFTILNCPSFKADPGRHGTRSETVIAISFSRRTVLIAGTAYAGENKKSIFTVLNYLLPPKGVMPMHCSANHAPGDPDDVAVFFGLSGTGKTTLSADPGRVLIGDDEHGWSDGGTFNFEGGCYAKTINLSAEAEPEIYATTGRFATVVENMVYDPETFALDFDDATLTANTRCAYPLEAISNASPTARGGRPAQRGDADLRRLRGAAADRAADAGAGDVPLPVGLHLEGCGDGARRHGAAADVLDLLRRALHAAPAGGLRGAPAGPDRGVRRLLLAGEHRLDGRGIRDGAADADHGDARPSFRGLERRARGGGLPEGSELRLRRPAFGAGGGARVAEPPLDLGRSVGL
jgi:phosphoenolpyruvate carboxykinase (ATP)